MVIDDKIEYLCQIAYSTSSTLMHTYAMAQQAAGIDGCLVECGVGAGAQIMAMKIPYINGGKIIWGFDSFQGIPMASEHDATQPGIGEVDRSITNRMVSSGITVHSRDNVLDNFVTAGIPAYNVNLIRGWFIDTLYKSVTGAISLLRLDGDLYESTWVALDALYPRVSVGGIVIIDDYGLSGCRKAVADYFKAGLPDMIDVPDSGGVVYFVKS